MKRNRHHPSRLLSYTEALEAIQQDKRRCMRPAILVGSGTMVAWCIRDGLLSPVGEHGNSIRAKIMLGQWEVLTIEKLEKEEQERITGS